MTAAKDYIIWAKKFVHDILYVSTGNEAIGTTYWDSTYHTLSTVLENGVTLQHGIEMPRWVKNASGVAIANGTPVSVTNVGGSFITIAKTDITNTTSAKAYYGIATQDIAINAFGYVTTNGNVRDIDTSLFAEGVPLYVGVAPGTLTTTIPPAPDYVVVVGEVEYSHAIHGSINVSKIVYPKFQDLSDINGTPLAVSGQIGVWNETGQYFDFNYNVNNFAVIGTGIKIGDDATAASASNVGTIRYRVSANNSYCEMVMQTGASTYEWVVIKTNTW